MRQCWSADELEDLWSLSVDDQRSVGSKRGAARLGFAVLSKFFELEARFPVGPDEVRAHGIPDHLIAAHLRDRDLRMVHRYAAPEQHFTNPALGWAGW